jgi:hypothetical protein
MMMKMQNAIFWLNLLLRKQSPSVPRNRLFAAVYANHKEFAF